MKISKRLALGAVAVAGLAVAIPASAGNGGTRGSNSLPCADGTVTWSPTSVWPPNHKMQTVTITYVAPKDAVDGGDKTTIAVGAITDDQAAADGSDELNGSGQPTDQQGLDWKGTGNSATSPEGSPATTTAQVRAERSGHGQAGRTYSIQVMCSETTGGDANVPDPDPNSSGMQTLTVNVPHDQGNN